MSQLQNELQQQTPTLNHLRNQLTRVYRNSQEIQELNNTINTTITSPFASPAILRYEKVDSLRRRPINSINRAATSVLDDNVTQTEIDSPEKYALLIGNASTPLATTEKCIDDDSTPSASIAPFATENDEIVDSTESVAMTTVPENSIPSTVTVQATPAVSSAATTTAVPAEMSGESASCPPSPRSSSQTSLSTLPEPLPDNRTSGISDPVEEPTIMQLPVKEGFLMKRGFVNTAFQRRWFVLHSCYLFFYRYYPNRDLRGYINCQGATVSVDAKYSDVNPFSFVLHTPHDADHAKWVLQAASESEMQSWIAAITAAAAIDPSKVWSPTTMIQPVLKQSASHGSDATQQENGCSIC